MCATLYAMSAPQPNETSQRILIYLVGGERVEGDLHVPRHARLIDMLNYQADSKPFLALTNVEWRKGNRTTRLEFATVNRNHILAAHPVS